MLGIGRFCVTAALSVALFGCVDGGPPRPSTPAPHSGGQAADGGAPEPNDAGRASDREPDAQEPNAEVDAGDELQPLRPAQTTPSVSAKLCDGTPGITFSVAARGGGIAAPGTQVMSENGHSFLIVEGTCRFWALRGRMERVVTGELDEAALARLRESFGLDHWRSCRGTHAGGGTDTPDYHFVFGRSEHLVGNVNDCIAAPSGSAHEPGYLLKAYQSELAQLVAAGKPRAGDVRYLLLGHEGSIGHPSLGSAEPWPLGDPKISR